MAKWTRRTFFKAGVAPAFLPRARAAGGRPNLLFLIADDHAGYAMGCDGDGHARTPNLDRLASEGVRFSHSYCNCPVCTPSRQSLLTGQMPSAAGVTRLPTPLALGKPTFAEQLRKAGFHTGVIGKMHFHREPRPGLFGFDMMLTEDALERQWRKEVPGSPVPAGVRTRKFPWLPLKDPARLWLNADCLPYPRRDEEMLATYATRLAGEFLEENVNRPFALWVSFTEPHSPFDFPLEDRGSFDPAAFTPPRAGPEDAWQIPLCFADLTVKDKQGISAAHYTSVQFLDRNIGRVLTKLRDLGLDDNTLVVYVGDNGYCLGEHGRIEKHCGFEPALRTPLLMRLPGRVEPARVTDLVEMIDIAPTILDLLDAPALSVQHGQSLRPYLEGRKHPSARQSIVSEYPENEEVYVRTDRWKLIHGSGRRARRDGLATANPTPGRYRLLYDMQRDPQELHNLAAQHPAVVKDLQQTALERFRKTHPDAPNEPTGVPLEDALEFYLPPRDP